MSLGPYRKLYTRVWRSKDFKRLSRLTCSGQSLWLVLLAGPLTTPVPGLVPASLEDVAYNHKWTQQAVEAAWTEIELMSMATLDQDGPLIWIPKAIRYNRPTSINMIKGWSGTLRDLSECELALQAVSDLESFLKGCGKPWLRAFRAIIPDHLKGTIPDPKPGPSSKPKAKPRALAKTKPKALAKAMPSALPRPIQGAGTREQREDQKALSTCMRQDTPGEAGLAEFPDHLMEDPAEKVVTDAPSVSAAESYLIHLSASPDWEHIQWDHVQPLGVWQDTGHPVLKAPKLVRDQIKAEPMLEGVVVFCRES